MMLGRRIPGVEELVSNFRLEVATHFGYFVRTQRCAGWTYKQIAENEGVHPSTVRRYIKWFEELPPALLERYGLEREHAPTSNAVRLVCHVCGEGHTSARADKRFCSNACRQDAYRKRKLGAEPAA